MQEDRSACRAKGWVFQRPARIESVSFFKTVIHRVFIVKKTCTQEAIKSFESRARIFLLILLKLVLSVGLGALLFALHYHLLPVPYEAPPYILPYGSIYETKISVSDNHLLFLLYWYVYVPGEWISIFTGIGLWLFYKRHAYIAILPAVIMLSIVRWVIPIEIRGFVPDVGLAILVVSIFLVWISLGVLVGRLLVSRINLPIRFR